MNNWIPDTNRWNLAAPPFWWLKALWEFDSSLVVVPSRQQCIYRLAQRRDLKLPDHMVNDPLFNESDTKMMASYGLVPVTSIMATANWHDPYMFIELANRAPWRMGGAKKVTDALEEAEAREEAKKASNTEEHLEYLGSDAWKLYNKKIGVRSHMYIPRTRSNIVGGNKAPSFRIK